MADTARIRARESGNRRTEEEEGRNRGRRRKKQQNTIGGMFQFVFFIARSSPVDSYIVHYKASWPTKRPMAGDNNFGPKPETVRNGLLPAHSFAIRYRCCRTVTQTIPNVLSKVHYNVLSLMPATIAIRLKRFWYYSTFVVICQLMSNHGLIRLKRFTSC